MRSLARLATLIGAPICIPTLTIDRKWFIIGPGDSLALVLALRWLFFSRGAGAVNEERGTHSSDGKDCHLSATVDVERKFKLSVFNHKIRTSDGKLTSIHPPHLTKLLSVGPHSSMQAKKRRI